MKRPITSALLAAALSLSLVVPAGAVSSSTAVEAIQALGIITGDSSGNLNLSSPRDPGGVCHHDDGGLQL